MSDVMLEDDELGGECAHALLADEIAALREGNAELVKAYCLTADAALVEALREGRACDERYSDLKSAKNAILIAARLSGREPDDVLAHAFEPLISQLLKLASGALDPCYLEDLEPAKAVAELKLASDALDALFLIIGEVCHPQDLAPGTLGQIAQLANCASAICGDALVPACEDKGEPARRRDTRLAEQAAPLAADLYIRLVTIHHCRTPLRQAGSTQESV